MLDVAHPYSEGTEGPSLKTGLVLSDVDNTLHDATRAIVRGITGGHLKQSCQLHFGFLYWMAKKLKGRDWFAQKKEGLYQAILQQNGPERMAAFYDFVARTSALHNAGALDLLRGATQANLHLVLISGNDAAFLESLMALNGLGSDQFTAFGTKFEVKNGAYTGHFSGMNNGAAEKAAIIQGLRIAHPNLPVRLALGDDSGDFPLFEAARADRAPSILVGDDRIFRRELQAGGFWVTCDLDAFIGQTDRPGRVLQVSRRPNRSKMPTLKDVAERLHTLLESQ